MTSGHTVRLQTLLPAVQAFRHKLLHWKNRLGRQGRYPEIWGDIDNALKAIEAAQEKLFLIQKELQHDRFSKERNSATPSQGDRRD